MSWDYIIVGAGSAGCALVDQLIADGEKSVLVLEAGGSDRSPFIRFPAGQLRAMARHSSACPSQPDPSRDGATERWWRGRVLGGSSSINGTMYVRGAAEDFDRWADRYGCGRGGATGWSAADVIPIFRELECSDQPGPNRGRAGRLHVRTVRRAHAVTRAFLQSAQACGYSFNPDYNGDRQDGVAFAQLSQRYGLRCSSADAFLRPRLESRNLELQLNASVEKIEMAGGRAVAVQYVRKGRHCRAIGKEIVLCAGAIDSPRLLMLSGIGDAQELGRHGIDVQVNLPQVGRNLKEHPLLRLVYRATIPTYNPQGVVQRLGFAAAFVCGREGPISNLFEGAAFLRSSAEQELADIQLHLIPAGCIPTQDGGLELACYPSFTVLLNKSRPLSRGRVRLATADPNDFPLIECQLLEERADLDTLVRGVAAVRSIVSAEPLASLVAEEVMPGPTIAARSALENYVRRHTGIAFHAAGTCRMGADPDAVVGPDLRVRGIENLWIADASVMPDLVGGNTNAVCMMIGAKLGKQLRKHDVLTNVAGAMCR